MVQSNQQHACEKLIHLQSLHQVAVQTKKTWSFTVAADDQTQCSMYLGGLECPPQSVQRTVRPRARYIVFLRDLR